MYLCYKAQEKSKLPWNAPAEVEKRKKEMLNIWENEEDNPMTYTEILKKLSKEDGFWLDGRGKRNLSKYLERLIDDRRLIQKGERGTGKKGATYRPNRAGITTRELLENLRKINNFCSSKGLYNFRTIGWFDCDLFGVPPDKHLSPFELAVVQTIRWKLTDAWQLLYHLKYVLAAHKAAGYERRDLHTLGALYEYEFFNSLHNIFFFNEPNIRIWKDFLDDLSKQMVSLTKKYGLRDSTGAGLKRVMVSFSTVEDESFLDDEEISILVSEKMIPDSENLALVVTHSFTQAEEFRGKIENWIYGWTEFIRGIKKSQYNKFQELVNLIQYTERGIMQWHQRLTREEKEKLRDWPFLTDRYGKENVNLFLDLVDELNKKELKLFDEHKHELDSVAWIVEKLREMLNVKGLLERYTNEAF